MIRIEGVTKRFGRVAAVDGVSLYVAPGESVALWGANGAGKSTILRCVLGLLRYSGRIEVGGWDARRKGKWARRLIGYVPQELGFNDDLRVGEAIGLFARLKGVDVRSADEVLGRVGLAGQIRKRMRELSGGMKQRLALALALLGDPPVLILDEVTASLDACGREEFVSLLAGLSGAGRSMLFASHRVDEITALADRVVVLDRGRIVEQLPSAEFAARQGHQAVLHITVNAPARERATEILRSAGFTSRLNGVGLLIPVRAPHRGVPLRVLAEGGVRVDDFDVLPGASAPRREGVAP